MDNNQDLMRQLQQNKDALLQMMHSADGQRLIAMMQQQSGLQQAAGGRGPGGRLPTDADGAAADADPRGRGAGGSDQPDHGGREVKS